MGKGGLSQWSGLRFSSSRHTNSFSNGKPQVRLKSCHFPSVSGRKSNMLGCHWPERGGSIHGLIHEKLAQQQTNTGVICPSYFYTKKVAWPLGSVIDLRQRTFRFWISNEKAWWSGVYNLYLKYCLVFVNSNDCLLFKWAVTAFCIRTKVYFPVLCAKCSSCSIPIFIYPVVCYRQTCSLTVRPDRARCSIPRSWFCVSSGMLFYVN